MLHLKHDVQIHLKNEKEVFRVIRLILFTFLFSAAFLGLPDYIWNITLYKIAKFFVPWIIAIPAILNCIARKKTLKELFGEKILLKVLFGFLFGIAFALIMKAIMSALLSGQNVLNSYEYKSLIYNALYYYFSVAMAEELIYRVSILENLEAVMPKWIAFIIADLLFAGYHLFQGNLFKVVFNIFAGAIYIALYKWKKGGYVFAVVMHGTYDFFYMNLSVITYLLLK